MLRKIIRTRGRGPGPNSPGRQVADCSRIVKDFYMKERDSSKRPKIFGMTASPVDAKVDVVKAARYVIIPAFMAYANDILCCSNLELLLDAEIATATNLNLLRQSVARPTEEAWLYDRLDSPLETDLHRELRSRFGDIPAFDRLFRFSLEASSTLGAWCSDWIWSYGLAEDVLPQVEARATRNLMKNMPAISTERSDSEIQRIRAAGELIKSHRFIQEPKLTENLFSPKVRLLYQRLSMYFERHTDTKCIVFTAQRHTARILGDLFRRMRPKHLRPGWLIGVRSHDSEGMKVSHRQQFLTLLAFRKGDLNCLVRSTIPAVSNTPRTN